jgi:hypothetical protein
MEYSHIHRHWVDHNEKIEKWVLFSDLLTMEMNVDRVNELVKLIGLWKGILLEGVPGLAKP